MLRFAPDWGPKESICADEPDPGFTRYLCSACGYLSTTNAAPCPACGEPAWLNLADPTSVGLLRRREDAYRHRVPLLIRIAVLLVLVGGVAVGAWLADEPLVLVVGAVAVIPLYLLPIRLVAWLLLRIHPRGPYRWRLPVPQPPARRPAAAQSVSGAAEGGAEPLCAPFTGRPCLAWQACVLFDAPGDARPPEWVLQEVEAVDFVVGGLRLAGARVMLRLPLRRVTQELSEAVGQDWQRFLAERGLFHEDGAFDLFECCVEPGQQVRVRRFDSPETFVVERDSDYS